MFGVLRYRMPIQNKRAEIRTRIRGGSDSDEPRVRPGEVCVKIETEIPDEFLRGIAPCDLAKYMSDNGFVKYAEYPEQVGKPEIWKHRDFDGRFMVCADASVSDYARMVCEAFRSIRKYAAGISTINSLRAFGWGKCRTCGFLCTIHNNDMSDSGYGDCDYPETQIDSIEDSDSFGCIHYEFKGIK